MKTINEIAKLYYDVALECKKKYYVPNTDITNSKNIRKYLIEYSNSLRITSVIKEDELSSINELEKMLNNGVNTIILTHKIENCLSDVLEFTNIMPIYILFNRVIPSDDVCNLIVKKYGKEYKEHWKNFKKLMNLKSLLYEYIDTL